MTWTFPQSFTLRSARWQKKIQALSFHSTFPGGLLSVSQRAVLELPDQLVFENKSGWVFRVTLQLEMEIILQYISPQLTDLQRLHHVFSISIKLFYWYFKSTDPGLRIYFEKKWLLSKNSYLSLLTYLGLAEDMRNCVHYTSFQTEL